MKPTLILKNCFLAAIAAIGFLACTPTEVENGNPLTQGDLNAAFDGVTTDGNHFRVTASDSPDILYHVWKWTTTDGTNSREGAEKKGSSTMDFTFTTPGTYTVQHRVVSRTGGISFVQERPFVVTTTLLILGPNLIQSPNFENPSDWTVVNINPTGSARWTFADGKATIAGATGHAAIYQAVTVEAGRSYKFDMRVQGPGSSNTWFEVYAGTAAPSQGADYGDGGKRLQLNTWAHCATSSFNGMLSAVGCGGDSSGNVMTFERSGTVYFLMKCGESNGNINSISVSEVVFQTID
jgi:hypothetical protein